ncbi:MAG: class I SAM-dependent methyltransferase [Candidatus Paceibacterota bacterium]|jgi:hypothetical protein
MNQWEAYNRVVGNVPNSIVVHTLNDFVTRRSASLDLGAGNLRDSKFLLGQGFTKVVAVDSSKKSLAFLTEGIELHFAPIETFMPEKNTFDFVLSCNTLFYLTPEQIADIFQNVLVGLRSGGVFACNVLGKEDDWVVQGQQVSSFSEETLMALATGFDVLGTGEGKNRGQALDSLGVLGRKYWHQLSIVAQKP